MTYFFSLKNRSARSTYLWRLATSDLAPLLPLAGGVSESRRPPRQHAASPRGAPSSRAALWMYEGSSMVRGSAASHSALFCESARLMPAGSASHFSLMRARPRGAISNRMAPGSPLPPAILT